MPDQNKTRHEAGQNTIQSSSTIVAVIGNFAVAFAVCGAVGVALIGVVELVRWLGSLQ